MRAAVMTVLTQVSAFLPAHVAFRFGKSHRHLRCFDLNLDIKGRALPFTPHLSLVDSVVVTVSLKFFPTHLDLQVDFLRCTLLLVASIVGFEAQSPNPQSDPRPHLALGLLRHGF